ncbi:uncharacterized protein LOC123533509 [Mercenaria mercenaria]|uniref:uncharacterized protein LOC123533509 n=1 Tax=Mercenaria mercenaria TaxID=6596 RepID=UPI00234EE336|nr:uncharacterized protein LOC123533509 [Mercenaria mercenaria]
MEKGQRLLNEFWRIWRDEYLICLRERMQAFLKAGRVVSQNGPKVEDIVLIKDNTPRGSWKIGKIQELLFSRDGEVRSAKINLPSGKVLGRPLNRLYPVECSTTEPEQTKKKSAESEIDKRANRPRKKPSGIGKKQDKRKCLTYG